MGRGSRWTSKQLRRVFPLPGERATQPRFDGPYSGSNGLAARFHRDGSVDFAGDVGTWKLDHGTLRIDTVRWQCEGAIDQESVYLLCSPAGHVNKRTQNVLQFAPDGPDTPTRSQPCSRESRPRPSPYCPDLAAEDPDTHNYEERPSSCRRCSRAATRRSGRACWSTGAALSSTPTDSYRSHTCVLYRVSVPGYACMGRSVAKRALPGLFVAVLMAAALPGSALGAWSYPKVIAQPASLANSSINAAGDALLLWHAGNDYRGTGPLTAAVENSDGVVSAPETLVPPRFPASDPGTRALLTSTGDAFVFWDTPNGTFVAHRAPGGQFEAAQKLFSGPSGYVTFASSDPAGNVLVLINQNLDQDRGQTLEARRPAGGSFEPAHVVMTSPHSDYYAALASSPGGRVVAVAENYGYREPAPHAKFLIGSIAAGLDHPEIVTLGEGMAAPIVDVAVNDQGALIAAWFAGDRIWSWNEIAVRGPGEPRFAQAHRIARSIFSETPSVAIDSRGNGLALTTDNLDAISTWSGPEANFSHSDTVPKSYPSAGAPAVSFDGQDNAVITRIGPPDAHYQGDCDCLATAAATRSGNPFPSPDVISFPGNRILGPISSFSDGRGVSAWTAYEPGGKAVETSLYQADAPPEIKKVTLLDRALDVRARRHTQPHFVASAHKAQIGFWLSRRARYGIDIMHGRRRVAHLTGTGPRNWQAKKLRQATRSLHPGHYRAHIVAVAGRRRAGKTIRFRITR